MSRGSAVLGSIIVFMHWGFAVLEPTMLWA
jgi:hypothetical protein